MSRSKDYERECPCASPESCRRKDATGHRVRYVVRFEKPPGPDGNRRQGKRRFKSTDEAKLFRAKTITSVASGTYVDPAKLPLSRYLRDWLGRKERTLKPGPLADYRWRCEKIIIPHIGAAKLGDVRRETLDHLFDCIAEDEGHDLGPTSLHLVLAVLSSALSDALDRDLIARNPCFRYAKNHLPAKSTPKVSPWTPAQTSAFLAHVAEDRYSAVWRLYAIGGLRRGEGIGLRWRDVDLATGQLTVAQSITLAGGRVVVGRPKTKAGENRVVALDAATVAALKAIRKRTAAERLAAGAAYDDAGLVFCDEIGRLVRPEAISYRFRQLAAGASLPRIRLHDLRHGAVSMMLATGIPLPVVSKLIGHSQMSTTSDLYGHLVEGTGSAAADAVAALLSGASNA